MSKKKYLPAVLSGILVLAVLLGFGVQRSRRNTKYTDTTFVMDTVVTQSVWGPHAEAAMTEAARALADIEAKLSLYSDTSEVTAINAAAGVQAVPVSPLTLDMLDAALTLSARSEGYFQITVAPLSRLWNIMGENPTVPAQAEIDTALALIDDTALTLDAQASTVQLAAAGQALDLGGIAKGYSCDVLRQLYLDAGVQHALTSIGGNIVAVGGNVDGSPFRIGFRDPKGGVSSYIASFLVSDGVVAVSGAYERYFEQDGVIYHHILDPHTGYPAQSDIVSVGVVWPAEGAGENPGASADHWSTTLFCWGRDKTLEWMKSSPAGVLLLDDAGTLYVSASLREGFRTETAGLEVVFVEEYK